MKTYQVKTPYGTFKIKKTQAPHCCIVYLWKNSSGQLECNLNGFEYTTWSSVKKQNYLLNLPLHRETKTGIGYGADAVEYFYDIESVD